MNQPGKNLVEYLRPQVLDMINFPEEIFGKICNYLDSESLAIFLLKFFGKDFEECAYNYLSGDEEMISRRNEISNFTGGTCEYKWLLRTFSNYFKIRFNTLSFLVSPSFNSHFFTDELFCSISFGMPIILKYMLDSLAASRFFVEYSSVVNRMIDHAREKGQKESLEIIIEHKHIVWKKQMEQDKLSNAERYFRMLLENDWSKYHEAYQEIKSSQIVSRKVVTEIHAEESKTLKRGHRNLFKLSIPFRSK